jgi:adenylate cyclase
MFERVRTVVVAAAVIGAVIGVAAWMGLRLGLADGLRGDATDSFFPRGRRDPRVMVIALDRSFSAMADLDPLNSYQNLITVGERGGATTIIIDADVLATAKDQTSFALGTVSFESALSELVRPLGNVVLPIPEARLGPAPAGSGIPVLDRSIPSSLLADAAAATGVANVIADSPDAVTRAVPLAVRVAGPSPPAKTQGITQIIPSIALIGLLRAEHLDATVLERRGGLDVGGRFIPTEDDQRLRVDYAKGLLPGGAGIVSATELIDGKVPTQRLRGKTVLVGMTDPKHAHLLPAPVGASGQLPSVFVQANALNTLLTRQYITPSSDATTVFSAMALAFAVALLVLLLPFWLAPIPPLFAGAGYWLYAASRFEDGQVVDVLYPLAGITVALVAAVAWKGGAALLQRRRVANLFARYVPATVVTQLLETGQAQAAAAGQRLDVGILFCDIRGFTPIAAQLEPGQVRELLDCYYERVSQIVLDRNGTVLHFIGDEVFAVFGAPLPQPIHVTAALQAARHLLSAVPELRAELVNRRLPPVEYGIGLHAGAVIAAHVGSSAHRQYDLVGDAVNVGSRLCATAGPREIILSGEVMAALDSPIDAEPLGTLDLKGVGGRIVGYRIRANSHSNANTIGNGDD